ncbi:unnamed protein product [Parascedosporium putredinis]|uniref:Uncharacterized protein n=1 Tax=Parascedosporium putredinis TaxID=1442378 RepID=A0A9P1MGG0_9PEZI|nr:unnamed protein product [Parascedosporium putredinis]CAI8004369.1 unnamed protein product [Parascedosporium putredinis]
MWWSKSSPAPSANPKPSSLRTNEFLFSRDSWRWPDPPPDVNAQSTAFAPQDDEENGSYNLSNTNKTERTKRETICGIRRKVFFLIIIGGALVAIAAVAIGIGAGIAFSKKRKTSAWARAGKPGDSDADGDEGGKCILKGHIGESESDGDGIFALRVDNPNKI